MPSPKLNKKARIKDLCDQIDAFMDSDALKALFDALDTDADRISEMYNARSTGNGKVVEIQVIGSKPELDAKRDELYPLFSELGFFGINKPLSQDCSRIVVLGASLCSTYLKTKAAKKWITGKVNSVDALTCFRPINPVERVGDFMPQSDTEFGCASEAFADVFDLGVGQWEDDFTSDRNLNGISCIRRFSGNENTPEFRIFAAPSSEPSKRRADTGDTLDFYLENGGITPGESLLAVTGNRYCNRQFLQLAYILIRDDHPIGLDVIGNSGDDDLERLKNYDPNQYLQDIIALTDWAKRLRNDFV